LPTGSARTGKDIILQINWRCKMNEIQEALSDIKERLVRVETKIDDGLKDRLDKVEGNQTWLWRTTIGGIIAGAITFIFKWGGK